MERVHWCSALVSFLPSESMSLETSRYDKVRVLLSPHHTLSSLTAIMLVLEGFDASLNYALSIFPRHKVP